jgi:hypothetical protein
MSCSAARPPHARALSAPIAVAAAVAAMLAAFVQPAAALKPSPDEEAVLKACEKQICKMILGKQPTGADLACGLEKTWAKERLEEGNSKGVSWGFGDARCTVDVKLSRAELYNALTKPKHKVFIPAHDVKCVIEREGSLQPVTARLAPKLVFKNGKADKVWINLENIDGPADVKSTISAAAKLEDSLGIFHGPMIKQINKFMHQQCAKRYGPAAVATPKEKKAAAEKKLAATKKTDGDTPAAQPAATAKQPASPAKQEAAPAKQPSPSKAATAP